MALAAGQLDRETFRQGALPALALVGVCAVGVVLSAVPPVFALGAAAGLVIVLLAVRAPRAVVLGTLFVLPFVGVVRRATNSYATTLDPLALIGPVLAGVCLLVLAHTRSERHRTALTGTVTAMVVLGVLEIANPMQGGPVIGVVGAGLFVGPLVWFYVGRRVGDVRTLARMNGTLATIALIAALYGTKQLLFGFSGFEERWIAARLSSYAALDISGTIRPFSTFASGAEYSYFLVLGAVLFTVRRDAVGRSARIGIVLALLLACFFAGTRSIFVTGVLAVLTAGLVHRIKRLGRALALCIAVGVAALALVQLVPLSSDSSATGVIRNRTLVGLARPFDREVSTLGLHLDSFSSGLLDGIRHPLGRGGGAVNLAGSKLGAGSVSSEHDVPNVLIAYGWAGGLLLILLLTQIYRVIGSSVRDGRPEVVGPAIFVLALFGAWFAGELYAASALVWFFIGALDRIQATTAPATAQPARGATAARGAATTGNGTTSATWTRRA